MIVAASSSKSSSSSTTFLLIIVVLIVIFYFLMIRPQRNRARKVQEQQNSVQPGARVRTTAGMYATVIGVDGNDVVLEVAPGVEVRYLKRAIMEVLPGETGDGAMPAEAGYAETDYAETGYAETGEAGATGETYDDSEAGVTGETTGGTEATTAADGSADGHAATDEKTSRSV